MSGSGISWAICKSAPRSRQKTTPAPRHSIFLQAGCPNGRPTNTVKALKAISRRQSEQFVICPIILYWLHNWNLGRLAGSGRVAGSPPSILNIADRKDSAPECCHLLSYFERPKSSPVRPLACNCVVLLRKVYDQARGCVCAVLQLGGDVEQPWHMSKYDVIRKTGSTHRITTPPERGESHTHTQAHRQTDRQTDKRAHHNTPRSNK